MLGGSSESPSPSGTRIVRWNEMLKCSPEAPVTSMTSLHLRYLDDLVRVQSRPGVLAACVRVMTDRMVGVSIGNGLQLLKRFCHLVESRTSCSCYRDFGSQGCKAWMPQVFDAKKMLTIIL